MSVGRVARSGAAIGYHPLLAAASMAFTRATSEDPNVRRDNAASAAAVVSHTGSDTPGQREYHLAMARYAPGAFVDQLSITVWAAGKLVEAAVEGLGAKARNGALTIADMFVGLGTIRNETLGGLSPPMTFAPGQKSAPRIDCAYYELLTEKGWTAPRGSRRVCV